MTLEGMAARLASMTDSTVIIVLERWTFNEQVYLTSNLRAVLELHRAGVMKHDPTYRTIRIRKTNGSQLDCRLTSIDKLGEFLPSFHPNTPVFTISRTGIYESKAR